MLRNTIVLADEVPFPPSIEDFHLVPAWVSKFTVLVWVAVALIIIFFLTAYRNPKLVPTRGQWLAESLYGFVRDRVAGDLMGHEGIRFAPYLTTLFSFILLTNLFGIIPGIQISTNTHIAFPVILAVISWLLFIIVGIRRFGFVHYFKKSLILPAPLAVQPILIPIEFASTFIVRPVTLAIRLFANMFAGHVILLVFTLGGFVLFNSSVWLLKPLSLLSWVMAILLTFLEALVVLLQAYVFMVLTASYVQGSLAEEH